jgi:hypothetical protein
LASEELVAIDIAVRYLTCRGEVRENASVKVVGRLNCSAEPIASVSLPPAGSACAGVVRSGD